MAVCLVSAPERSAPSALFALDAVGYPCEQLFPANIFSYQRCRSLPFDERTDSIGRS